MTVNELREKWDALDAVADDAGRAVNAQTWRKALGRLRRIEARETAILKAAGYFRLQAKANEAEATVDRAVDQILSYPVASWSDAAALLRFMGLWEPFDDADERTRDGDMVTRAYLSLKDGVARKARL